MRSFLPQHLALLLSTAMFLALPACDDDYESFGADAGPQKADDPAAGEPIDIAAQSSANGFTLVTLPLGTLSDEVIAFPDIAPAPFLESRAIRFDIPDDVVSFVLIVDNHAAGMEDEAPIVTSFKVPGEGEQVTSLESFSEYKNSKPYPSLQRGIATLMRPRTGEQEVAGGIYELKVALTKDLVDRGEKPRVRLGIRRGESTGAGRLAVNMIFVDGALESSELNAFVTQFQMFTQLFAGAGLRFDATRLGIGYLTNPAFNTLSGEYADQVALQAAPVEEEPEMPLVRDGAITFYILREAGNIYGRASGIPGALGTFGEVASSVFIAAEPHRVNGVFDIEEFYKTMVHEAGHQLGLNHTTEQNGLAHDPISDTLECPSSADTNGDGSLSVRECDGLGGQYNMFWAGTESEYSPHQRNVLVANPIVVAAP